MIGYFIFIYLRIGLKKSEKKNTEKTVELDDCKENLCQNVHNRIRRPCPTQLLELHDRIDCALHLFRVIPRRIQLEVMAARNLFRDLRGLQALHHPEVLLA